MRQPTELAWAAGFFDGEGNVRVRNSGGFIDYPVVCVTQYHSPETSQRLKNAVGFGAVYGPYTKSKQCAGQYYQYACWGYEQVQALGAMLWPYLSAVKRNQFSDVLKLARSSGTHQQGRK